MVKERGMDLEMTPSILSDSNGKSDSRSSSPSFEQEKDLCFTYFDGWSQEDQVSFIEQILGRMTHYQHGQINSFLKPMLQRDFISALPGSNFLPFLAFRSSKKFILRFSMYTSVLFREKLSVQALKTARKSSLKCSSYCVL